MPHVQWFRTPGRFVIHFKRSTLANRFGWIRNSIVQNKPMMWGCRMMTDTSFYFPTSAHCHRSFFGELAIRFLYNRYSPATRA